MPEPIIVYVVKKDELPSGGFQFIGLETWNERSEPVLVKRKVICGKYKKKESLTVEEVELVCEHLDAIKKASSEFMRPVESGSTERLQLIERMK